MQTMDMIFVQMTATDRHLSQTTIQAVTQTSLTQKDQRHTYKATTLQCSVQAGVKNTFFISMLSICMFLYFMGSLMVSRRRRGALRLAPALASETSLQEPTHREHCLVDHSKD